VEKYRALLGTCGALSGDKRASLWKCRTLLWRNIGLFWGDVGLCQEMKGIFVEIQGSFGSFGLEIEFAHEPLHTRMV